MADITANFTIYKGHHHSELKHIATVFRQSNFRDALQLIKQIPFNGNIFVNSRNVKSVIEFLVPFKPLNNIDLTPIVLLFFTSNLILTKGELKEFQAIVKHFSSEEGWENKWATLENEEFLRVISPFLDIVSNRIEQTSHLNNSNELVETSDDDYNMFVTSYFKSPIDDQEYSVISYNTAILS